MSSVGGPTGIRARWKNLGIFCHERTCRQRELRDTQSQQPISYSRRLRNRKLPFAEYCYACCKWSCSEDDWSNHCKWHLENLTMRCGLLTFRYTLAIAGYCPYCVGDESLSPSQRMQQWMTKSTLLNHIDKHLETGAKKGMSTSLMSRTTHERFRLSGPFSGCSLY